MSWFTSRKCWHPLMLICLFSGRILKFAEISCLSLCLRGDKALIPWGEGKNQDLMLSAWFSLLKDFDIAYVLSLFSLVLFYMSDLKYSQSDEGSSVFQ